MKRVNFNMDIVMISETYSKNEYDRSQIESILYMKCYNRISHEEWMKERNDLNKFKYTEMIVHKKSIKNTHFI